MWGVSKLDVADFAFDLIDLLTFILKHYTMTDNLRYRIKGEMLKQIKINFVEFHKNFIFAFKEDPSQK